MRLITTLLALACLLSCSTEPEKMNFGSDQCSFCKMNIVDPLHAAQYVTKKGKQYKFDAIECMLDVILKEGDDHIENMLVSDYDRPKSMIPAKEATYLICKEIKSPMGAYLSAFGTRKGAQKTQKEFGGDIYNWEEIIAKRAEF